MNKILIVGASSGIGLSLAARYADRGDKVVCISRRDCPDTRIFTYRADMAKESERNAAIRYLEEHDQLPDTFIYCAAASMSAPAEYITDQHMRYLWEVNYFAFVAMAQQLLPHIAEVKGKIVAIGSMASVAPIPFDAHYSASKSALNTFAAVLQQEVAPYGVYVTVVLPGGTATGFSFKRLVYDSEHCGKYYAESQKSAFTLGKMEQTGMPPAKAAELIQRHIDRRMGLFYPVGAVNGVTYLACKHLPQAVKSLTIRSIYATEKQN